jgi:hypothetical protein
VGTAVRKEVLAWRIATAEAVLRGDMDESLGAPRKKVRSEASKAMATVMHDMKDALSEGVPGSFSFATGFVPARPDSAGVTAGL